MLERGELSEENEESFNNKLDDNNYKLSNSISKRISKAINSEANKSEDLLGSEEIFINLKKEIETVKKRNEAFHLKKESTKSMNNNIHANNDTHTNNNKFKLLSKNDKDNINEEESINDMQEFKLNDDNINFECSNFNSRKKGESFNLNKTWKNMDKNFPKLSEVNNIQKGYEYIELNQLAIRVIKEIDFDEMGIELNLNFNLIGSSQIFIFTRSFVNKDINESGIFEDDIYNIDTNDMFNKYTSLIKISKDMKNRTCFITFGTYYNDKSKNNKLCHKFFLQRQLIDYSEEKDLDENKKSYQTEFNMILNDLGDETINTRIFLNKNKKPNDVSGNFFLPINKKAKIMIFGMGTSVRLRDIGCKIFNKRNESIKNLIKFESENSAPKNCQCCNII